MTLRELIEVLEKATCGTSELDSRIAEYLGIEYRSRRTGYGASKGREWLVSHVGGVSEWTRHPPAYTNSLDAALTLVPEGWHVGGLTNVPGLGWDCTLWASHPARRVDAGTDDKGRSTGRPATPALALTLACMKAREAMG